jgi:hypothetical protein
MLLPDTTKRMEAKIINKKGTLISIIADKDINPNKE